MPFYDFKPFVWQHSPYSLYSSQIEANHEVGGLGNKCFDQPNIHHPALSNELKTASKAHF